MRPKDAAQVIKSIDISRFPSSMDLTIEVNEYELGVDYKVYFTVESNLSPFNTIKLFVQDRIETIYYLELDIVRHVRNTIAHVLLHELDESLYLNDCRVYETHNHFDDSERINVSCLCSSYMCEHSQGKGLLK